MCVHCVKLEVERGRLSWMGVARDPATYCSSTPTVCSWCVVCVVLGGCPVEPAVGLPPCPLGLGKPSTLQALPTICPSYLPVCLPACLPAYCLNSILRTKIIQLLSNYMFMQISFHKDCNIKNYIFMGTNTHRLSYTVFITSEILH